MKIAWFSPMPPVRSSIADYTVNLLRHLRHRVEVDVQPTSGLEAYDAVIYNVGNHLALHRETYERMRRHPGVVILHDYVLANLYADYWLGEKKDWNRYRAQFAGEDAAEMVELMNRYLEGSEVPLDELFRYPMNHDVVASARGVVVHSEFARDLLQRGGCRKVVHLNQPAYSLPRRAVARSREELGLPRDKCVLITLGPLDSTRRIDRVFDMLARAPDILGQIHYVLVGESDPRVDIAALAHEYDLTSRVTMTGYLPTEEMYDYIDAADIGIALRNPTMGEASTGVVRLLERGKPCIATEVGWYAELPSECVAKVSPARELFELRAALAHLVSDSEARSRMGAVGKHLVETHFTAAGFVDGLIRFIESLPAPGKQPGRVLSEILQTVGDVVAPLGIDSTLERVAEELRWAKD